MSKRFRALILVVFATVGVACRSETILAPDAPAPDAPAEEWRTIGNYQFTGLVTSGGWGDMTGARYTAFMTLEREQHYGRLQGLLTDMVFVSATEKQGFGPVVLSGSFANGKVSIYTPGGWPFEMHGVMLESGDIVGAFACCAIGDIRGEFTATRILR